MTNLSDLLPAGAASKQLNFVATGAISNGQAVGLKSDGTVAAISPLVGSTTTFDAASQASTIKSAIFDPDTNKIVIAYRDATDSKKGKCVIGTVSDMSISFGTPVVFESSTTNSDYAAAYDPSADKVVVAYQLDSNSHLVLIIGTVSGDSISFGSKFESSRNANNTDAVYDATAGKVIVSYVDSNNSNYPTLSLVNISGTTPSVSGTTVAVSAAASRVSITYDTTAGKTALCIHATDSSLKAHAVTSTSSSISVGSATTLDSTAQFPSSVYIPDINRHVVVFGDSSNRYGKYVIFEVSGTSITNNTSTAIFKSADIGNVFATIAYDTNADKVFIVYRKDATTKNAVAKTGTASTSALTLGDEITLNSAANSNTIYGIQATFDSNANRIVCSQGQDSSANSDANAFVFNINGGPANTDFLGIADAAISNAASGKITMKGGVAINSAISPAAVVTVGSQVVFDDGGPTTGISLVYDPDNSKIVNAFCTTTIHGIVGTVSGTGITYGTAVQANSNSSSNAQIVYDTANDKVVIVYVNSNTGYGEAVVGTVSGTSISFGSVVVWNSASTSGVSAAYDTNAGKVVVAWRNSGTAYGIVGTVSGTSISFGSSATIFSGGNLQETRMVYDTNAQKSVFIVRDASPQKGYAMVLTVSGTDVTAGSSVEFLSSEVTNQSTALAYNSTDNNVVIAYSKAGDSNNGFLAIGTISGTSISFAGETKFSSSNQTNYVKLAYKSSGNMLGIIYNIGGSTTVKFNHATISGTTFSFGTEQELTAGATDSTAITLDVASDNFVTSYGDGANSYDGTTNVVNLNTSLVPNTTYYVQNDGTLSTTSSSVTAGKAMSTTSINLDYST